MASGAHRSPGNFLLNGVAATQFETQVNAAEKGE